MFKYNFMKKLKRLRKMTYLIEKIFAFVINVVVIPGFYGFQMMVVRPAIVEEYHTTTFSVIANVIFSTFLFINVMGNLGLCILTDTQLGKNLNEVTYAHEESGNYCKWCKSIRPKKCWHCNLCNACILRRDHHCAFLARCVGRRNYRYFLLGVSYISLATTYALYWNYYFVKSQFQSIFQAFVSFVFLLNPFFRFIFTCDLGYKDFCTSYFILIIMFWFWSTNVAYYNMINAAAGLTNYERANLGKRGDFRCWKENLLNVFGVRWYFAVVWPFTHSPVPHRIQI